LLEIKKNDEKAMINTHRLMSLTMDVDKEIFSFDQAHSLVTGEELVAVLHCQNSSMQI